MACCGRKSINIPKTQQEIVKAVQNQSANKDRLPLNGARVCKNCYSKITTPICPVCGKNL